MKKYQLKLLCLFCALFVCTCTWAESVNNEPTDVETKNSSKSLEDPELAKKIENIISALPKISGYIQTGYNWGDKNGDNRSSFQMKRMRLFVDKKVSSVFDIRAQFEVFSGSTDGTPYKKKVMTIMDMFVNAHINSALNFRMGQYYLPLGFENYDISPSTLEVVDFSNICYRMVCRNAVSTPDLIDYGRDIGIMAYGDLFENKEKGFNYLSYNLSLTNGYLPTLNDDNKSKDFIGRITFRPIKNLRVMGSYNWGEYNGLNEDKEPQKYLPMNRIIAGIWYNDPSGLVLRSEYGHIKSSKANVKEDGFYALAGYKIDKLLPVVRWDMYRDKINKTSANNKDNLLIGCSYEVVKDVKFQLNYIHSIYPDKVKDAGVRTGSGNSLQVMCLVKF